MNSLDPLSALSEKMDTLIKIQAALAVKGMATQKEKSYFYMVLVLARALLQAFLEQRLKQLVLQWQSLRNPRPIKRRRRMSDYNHQEMMDILRTLLKVQSLSAVRHLPTKKEKILFLSEAGLSPKEIAPIVGSSGPSVSQAIYDAKKKNSKEG